jgi:hypothetical protein
VSAARSLCFVASPAFLRHHALCRVRVRLCAPLPPSGTAFLRRHTPLVCARSSSCGRATSVPWPGAHSSCRATGHDPSGPGEGEAERQCCVVRAYRVKRLVWLIALPLLRLSSRGTTQSVRTPLTPFAFLRHHTLLLTFEQGVCLCIMRPARRPERCPARAPPDTPPLAYFRVDPATRSKPQAHAVMRSQLGRRRSRMASRSLSVPAGWCVCCVR